MRGGALGAHISCVLLSARSRAYSLETFVMNLTKFAALALAAALSACTTLTEHTVTISQTQLQERLQAKLIAPIKVLNVFEVALSRPMIQLDAGSERMFASLDAVVSNPVTRALSGKATLSGKLRFDPISQSVLLTQPKIEALTIDGLGARSSELLSVLSQQLGSDLLHDLPLYTLKPDDLRVAGIRFAPKLMRITPQGLQVTLSPL